MEAKRVRLRLSIRSLMLLTLSVAIVTSGIAAVHIDADRSLLAAAGMLFSFIVIPLTSASVAYDVHQHRRPAELAAYYTFVVYSILAIVIGWIFMPVPH